MPKKCYPCLFTKRNPCRCIAHLTSGRATLPATTSIAAGVARPDKGVVNASKRVHVLCCHRFRFVERDRTREWFIAALKKARERWPVHVWRAADREWSSAR
jgi:hypothetical protein